MWTPLLNLAVAFFVEASVFYWHLHNHRSPVDTQCHLILVGLATAAGLASVLEAFVISHQGGVTRSDLKIKAKVVRAFLTTAQGCWLTFAAFILFKMGEVSVMAVTALFAGCIAVTQVQHFL